MADSYLQLIVFFVGAVMVARAVTVVITIAIAVTVSVSTTASLGPVQDQGHVFVFFFIVDLLQFREHAPFEQPCADYENGTVSQFLDNLRVGYQFNGRSVDQHIVILLPYSIDCLL